MERWKALLNQVFPGAEQPAPSESMPEYVEPPKVPDPLKRIHYMRKIKSGTGGFARLYGAKDLEQFRRQIVYMQDFALEEDSFSDIAFHENMPVYADMSVAQLQRYFQFRTKLRQGIWEPCGESYALLYVYELMHFEGNAAAIAEAWLRLREYYPKLDAKMQAWFKDYYLRCDSAVPFRDLVHELGLEAFYPAQQDADEKNVLRHSSYAYRESRLFHDVPALLPLLEQVLTELFRNLEPLFRLYSLPMEGLLFLQPTRFSHYELFRDAAVQPPDIGGSREIKISPSEHYRLRGGSWSRAMEDAFRPPSHGVGYLVKRAEARLRELAGYRPFNESGDPIHLLERWAHSGGFRPRFFDMVEDARFSVIIDECVRAAWKGHLPAEDLLPQAGEIARELESEPLKTLLRLDDVQASHPRLQFRAQGNLLAELEDNYAQSLPCEERVPAYSQLSHEQLRTYLTWRTRWRKGVVRPVQSAYAALYCCELLCGIGTLQPFEDLCRVLREYAAVHDKALAKRLSGWIRDFYVLNQLPESFAKLARDHHVEMWFPLQFLMTDSSQLLIFDQISSYKLTKSRFFDIANVDIFQECFWQVLDAATELFWNGGLDLAEILRETRGQAQWIAWRGLPVPYPKPPKTGTAMAVGGERYLSTGGAWICLEQPELPAWAAAFAAFLLKRMEQNLRLHAGYPYPLSAQQIALKNAMKNYPKAAKIVSENALAEAVDAAVQRFRQMHDVSALVQGKPKTRKKIADETPEVPFVPPKVSVDFSQLDRIRAEARDITESLIVEEEELETAEEQAEQMAPIEPMTGTDWDDFYRALNEAQRLCVAALADGKLCEVDALFVEEINELALDYIGDNLIDTAEEMSYIYEEYVSKWRECAE